MRKSPYQMIGGEVSVERLVKVFYDIVESDRWVCPWWPCTIRGMALHTPERHNLNFCRGFSAARN